MTYDLYGQWTYGKSDAGSICHTDKIKSSDIIKINNKAGLDLSKFRGGLANCFIGPLCNTLDIVTGYKLENTRPDQLGFGGTTLWRVNYNNNNRVYGSKMTNLINDPTIRLEAQQTFEKVEELVGEFKVLD